MASQSVGNRSLEKEYIFPIDNESADATEQGPSLESEDPSESEDSTGLPARYPRQYSEVSRTSKGSQSQFDWQDGRGEGKGVGALQRSHSHVACFVVNIVIMVSGTEILKY
jgi:hypothetical protein